MPVGLMPGVAAQGVRAKATGWIVSGMGQNFGFVAGRSSLRYPWMIR